MRSGSLPVARIAIWGLVLNAAWEFVQCELFYDMGSWGFWRITAWMWGATLGDVLIVLGIAHAALLVVDARHIAPPDPAGWLALLVLGLVAAVFLEWAARELGLWGYNEHMPTIEVAGRSVGLSPIIQITLLPALSVYLGTRRRARTTR